MSSLDGLLFAAAVVFGFSVDDKSVAVVVVSPALLVEAEAAAAFYFSMSEGTPLFSLISWVTFIMSRFLREVQFLMQYWKYPSLLVTGLPSRASSVN
jgi:hypothetical protein